MSLGKRHTILYPQDKSYNYKFPADNGTIATEEFTRNELAKYVVMPTEIIMDSSFRSNDDTLKDVSKLAFDVESGKVYRIELIGAYQSALATIGCKLGVRMVSGTGTIIGKMSGGITTQTGASELTIPIRVINGTASTTGASIMTTAVNPINTSHALEANLVFTCLTSGRFIFTFGNETTGTNDVYLMAGTYLKINEVFI